MGRMRSGKTSAIPGPQLALRSVPASIVVSTSRVPSAFSTDDAFASVADDEAGPAVVSLSDPLALDPALAAKVKEAFLTFDWKGSGLEQEFGKQADRFIPITFKEHWVDIRTIQEVNGTTYSRLIHGMKQANIGLNRKMLADLAVHDKAAFGALAEKAKAALG